MYCSNCRTEVTVANGYCTSCGTALAARLCPNGHVMDPSWTECQNCPPEARSAVPMAGKGGTAAEDPPGSTPAGGFVKGATILEGTAAGAKAATVREYPSLKGRTVIDTGSGSAEKKRTVFDPGVSESGEDSVAASVADRPKLVGWLVTFSLDPAGVDFRVREGRNTIGADAESCDIVISGTPSVSLKHAVVMFRDGKFQIRDSDSTNGTYVNGKDIFGEGAVPIENHAEIRVGDVKIALSVSAKS